MLQKPASVQKLQPDGCWAGAKIPIGVVLKLCFAEDQDVANRDGDPAEFWNWRHQDAAGEAHDNFLSHPLIQAYISMRAFNGSLRGHLEMVVQEIRRRSSSGARILSLGCGLADKEAFLAQQLPERDFVGLDLADQICELARTEVAAKGLDNLSIQVGDFNALDLEPNSFDLVLGLGAIHHVDNLEGLWEVLGKAIKPLGSVIAQEFVGADRFQWTEAQVEHGNRALSELVPEAHKTHHREVYRPPVELMIELDPSEAIRSSEILPTCRDAGWDCSAYVGAGCALLQPVLMNQIAGYDPLNWSHNRVLSSLFEREDQLMREGQLQDDFAMFVALPPK